MNEWKTSYEIAPMVRSGDALEVLWPDGSITSEEVRNSAEGDPGAKVGALTTWVKFRGILICINFDSCKLRRRE